MREDIKQDITNAIRAVESAGFEQVKQAAEYLNLICGGAYVRLLSHFEADSQDMPSEQDIRIFVEAGDVLNSIAGRNNLLPPTQAKLHVLADRCQRRAKELANISEKRQPGEAA